MSISFVQFKITRNRRKGMANYFDLRKQSQVEGSHNDDEMQRHNNSDTICSRILRGGYLKGFEDALRKRDIELAIRLSQMMHTELAKINKNRP